MQNFPKRKLTFDGQNLMLYLLKSSDRLKIGFATDMQMRLKAYATHNPWDHSGDSVTQPCTWIRPNTLIMDKFKGYKQIVGHTQVEKPYCLDDYVYLFDALANGWYGIVDTDVVYRCNIKTNEEEAI